MKLAEICEIRVGSILKRIEEKDGEKFKILQKSQLNRDELNLEDCDIVKVAKEKMEQVVISQKGDIVMKSTSPYNAFLIATDESLVLSSMVFRLRLNQEEVLPKFLLIWLENARSVSAFQKLEKGGVIKRVSARDLADLEIEIPEIKEQERLIELYSLQKGKIGKISELLEKEQTILEHIMNANRKEARNV